MLFEVLTDRVYRHLFAAQATALVGTGLMTVALGLLAYDLAGDRASVVLGTALGIKMAVYVVVAPLATAYSARWPRKPFLISMDLLRAALVLCLPWVSAVWQIYVLVAVLQTCSAAFTPTFQATIPDVLTDEGQYTRALSLSRLAYDLENLLSPLLAALLLGVISFRGLFGFTLLGFVSSAVLVATIALPRRLKPSSARPAVLDGMRRYLATPRLRGMLCLSLAEAAAGSLVIVNTVVYVRGWLAGDNRDVALTTAVFGGFSMVAALSLPRLLRHWPDRRVMLGGAMLAGGGLVLCAALAAVVPVEWRRWLIVVVWALIGAGYAAILTPGGRLLKRSGHAEDRPALFAAQFSLSHACWLLMYPLAGWLGSFSSPAWGAAPMAAVVALAAIGAARLWPAHDPELLEHRHDELPRHHPHLAAPEADAEHVHAHPYVIDDQHRHWPSSR
jgi:MFS family permease